MKRHFCRSLFYTFLIFLKFCFAFEGHSAESEVAFHDFQNDAGASEEDGTKGLVVDSRFGAFLPDFGLHKTSESHHTKHAEKSSSKKITSTFCPRFVPPVNTKSVCVNINTCHVTCLEGYLQKNGEATTTYICKEGQWFNVGTESFKVEICHAQCSPPCQNNGICVAPNICQCQEPFYGQLCEHERMSCSGYPATPMSSMKRCTPESCTVTCLGGRQFPDGSVMVDILCTGGKWVPSNPRWTEVPDCQPVCNPSCVNGGKCIDNNVCFCPNEYRGSHCQYSVDACDVSKLNFNGGYNCTGNEKLFMCELSCPPGMFTEEELAPVYTCDYSEGVFRPVSIPQCKVYRKQIIHMDRAQMVSSVPSSSSYITEPQPSSCFVWGPYHYKTFGGDVLSFKSKCTFILVSDEDNHLFYIYIHIGDNGIESVSVYINGDKYAVIKNQKGMPILSAPDKHEVYPIPSQLTELKVEIASGNSVLVYLPAVEVHVLWNLENTLRVDVPKGLWNRTGGLCSSFSAGSKAYSTTLGEYTAKWLIPETCDKPIEETDTCEKEGHVEARKFCESLKTNGIFSHCQEKLDVEKYVDACEWTYCNCKPEDRTSCLCKFVSMFVKTCSAALPEKEISWREQYHCTLPCKANQIYTTCMPISQQTCVSDEVKPTTLQKFCEEGCICPSGTAFHDGECITRDQCPCIFRGSFFAPGHVIQKDCNQCTCVNGKWTCTNALCKAVCTAVGDPHYSTFDGKKYSFLGKCTYTLVSTPDVVINAENSACTAGYVEKLAPLVVSTSSCTKSVIIHVKDGSVIMLRPMRGVSVDNVEINKLPFNQQNGVYIRKSSTFFIQVSLPNGLEVFWDGINRVIIQASPALEGKTKGLCGTFNRNQKDDLLTPEGDIEQDIVSFANKWKTKEHCLNPDPVDRVNPCDINIQNKLIAEKLCSNITGSLFSDCHSEINPGEYYAECLYDVCSCKEDQLSACLCPVISTYAEECARRGIPTDWRSYVPQCGITCPAGQKYELCGNSCQRSCSDISRGEVCKESCFEGCYCPVGYTYDENEECIPISDCTCTYHGHVYPAHHVEVVDSTDDGGFLICECKNAIWDCRKAEHGEAEKYRSPEVGLCDNMPNMEYTVCELPEPVTCKNMHNPPQYTPSICHAGCVCKKGYVLDSISKHCVKPTECPCHHGGQSYNDGDTMKEECNLCTCVKGKWECTKKDCPGICSSWGDTHFQTFDGKFYDFQGVCDYVFAKGLLHSGEWFSISVEIVPCGSGGTTCAKSITLNVGVKDETESVTFVRDQTVPMDKSLHRTVIYQAGLFVVAVVPQLSVALQWDKGTRIGVQVDQKWRRKLSGLCGNFNGDTADDFQTPSGGLVETSPLLFADSWKLQHHCPEPVMVQDPCVLHPHRKFYAVEKCSLLRSSPKFKKCHAEVPVDEYITRCIFDTCACDQGGDCECLCTAFAAYAQECSARGIHIKWRKMDSCPIQCEKGTEYSANITTCPDRTCDNVHNYESDFSMCKQLPCVEGCLKKGCPPGQVFKDDSGTECVPINSCVCMSINGAVYYENDVIESDACHTCSCSKGKKVCNGVPCSPSTKFPPILDKPKCRPGWTEWVLVGDTAALEKENIADVVRASYRTEQSSEGGPAICEVDSILNITCRTKSAEGGYHQIPCDFKKGVQCEQDCSSVELKAFCECERAATPIIPLQITVSKRECEPYWSGWFNPLDPEKKRYEPFSEGKKRDLCPVGYIDDIECVFQKVERKSVKNKVPAWHEKIRAMKLDDSWVNWTLSSDKNLVCDKDTGFVCVDEDQPNEKCHEYKIRVHCGCPPKVSTQEPVTSEIVSPCSEGFVWSSCKVKCNQLCLYYEHELFNTGRCVSSDMCIEGCVPKHAAPCGPGYYWRDDDTCIEMGDCTCVSKNGSLVKPGSVIHEDECSICQCVNNQYICSDSCITVAPTPFISEPSLIPEATTPIIHPTDVTTVFIVPAVTVSPPPPCDSNKFIPLEVTAFNATSSSGLNNGPEYAKLELNQGGIRNKQSWRSGLLDEYQYLYVDLGSVKPIYGLIVAGNPSLDEYVTVFKVLWSIDGISYSYLKNDNDEILTFDGPRNSYTMEKRIFPVPVETRYVRVQPVSWQGWISLQLQVLGCGLESSSTAVTPVCMEPMGLESGAMYPHQVTVSSSFTKQFEPSQAALSSTTAWIPFVASNNQWIQFDFLDGAVLTGIMTKGSPSASVLGEGWVEDYKVMYSHDGHQWNPVLDDNGEEKIFPANVDSYNVHTNFFQKPIQARYLRLYPWKWFNTPALRLEVVGCFKHYSTSTEEIITTERMTEAVREVTTVPSCEVCKGVQEPEQCYCSEGKLWDGGKCVVQAMCPCIVGFMKYDIGAVYMTEECEKCICVLGGIPDCKRQECPPCDEGMQRNLTKFCTCECVPCPEGTKLCPTSNICIKESLWCNGYKDCPDDETGCTIPASTAVTTESTITTTPKQKGPSCPPVVCPPGYKPIFTSSKKSSLKGKPSAVKSGSWLSPFDNSATNVVHTKAAVKNNAQPGSYLAMLQAQALAHSGTAKGKKTGKKSGVDSTAKLTEYLTLQKQQREQMEVLVCPDWRCEANETVCTKPSCPPGTQVKAIWTGDKCPSYECTVPPLLQKECTVDCRLISTFDGMSYRYDICDHILAEDRIYGMWRIKKLYKCPYVGTCTSSLVIFYMGDKIEFFTNFTATFNGYRYSIAQLDMVGSHLGTFTVRQISKGYVVFSSPELKFNVIWSSSGNVKITVDSSLHGMLAGLCGYFDYNQNNDKVKSDGKLASSTQEFGDSWKDGNDLCEAKVCPIEVQTKAVTICSVLKEEPLNVCGYTLNLEEQIAKCVERICMCSEMAGSLENKCRCEALQKYVTTCSLVQPGVDVSSWRVKYDCGANCTSPLIYQDCYNRQCEPGCDNLLRHQQCPKINDVCYPGCYCPDGWLKEGNTCVKPTSCRDCVCKGSGVKAYTTFDGIDVPLSAVCASFVMVKTNTTSFGKPGFSVILTYGPCVDKALGETCQTGITVITDNYEVVLSQSEIPNEIVVKVNGDKIEVLPYATQDFTIKKSVGQSVSLSFPSLELDVLFMTQHRGFSISFPSYLYADKTEGLCGICNGKEEDDILMPGGRVPEIEEQFVESWHTNTTAEAVPPGCVKKSQRILAASIPQCIPPQPDHDPCLLLKNNEVFQQCHAIVDVQRYITRCHDALCHVSDGGHCHAIESYAKECQQKGVCFDWRTPNLCPYTCPEGFHYEACSVACDVTCDNYKELNELELACPEPLVEKCVCPSGQVMSSGSCISEKRCHPCDKYGHYIGDKWKRDSCTMCVCLEEGNIQCQKKECPPETLCPPNFKRILDKNNDDICCEKYTCVYEAPSANCSEPIKPECGKDQILKMETTNENCTVYYCTCMPSEECPKVELMNDVELLPGMVKVEVKEGCCPSVAIKCQNDTCPPSEKCPPFYELMEEKITGECCPRYKCEIPEGKCVYEYHWIAAQKGGERQRTESEIYTELQTIGDVWPDGPCRSCICVKNESRGVCSPLQCPSPPESKDFIIEPFYKYGDCCPSYREVACKVNDTIYEVGAVWSVDGNPCVNISCAGDVETGVLHFQESVQSCNKDCKRGWKYVPAKHDSKECCGVCEQEACIDDVGMLHLPGSTWKSADNCTTFECGGQLQIVSYTEICPDVSSCPLDHLREEGCCKKCVIPPPAPEYKVCRPEIIPLNETSRLIRKDIPGHIGCFNKPLPDFTRCKGSCDTFEWYDDETSRYGAVCQCCVGIKYDKKQVEMVCEDNHEFYHAVELPVDCTCQQCGGNVPGEKLLLSTMRTPYSVFLEHGKKSVKHR